MPSTSLVFDRVVLGAAIVLTAVLFSARLADPVNVIKMTALVLCAITLFASCAVRAIRYRVVQLPWGLPALAGVVLLLAFVVVALASPVWHTAFYGTYGRNSGLLTYVSALVLFLVGLRVLDASGCRIVLHALMIAGGFTAGYGLLQYAGVDPVAWNSPNNPVVATLGNPNFVAAYVGICAPAAAWGALGRARSVGFRAVCAALLGLVLLAAALTHSAQGPVAAASGLTVVLLAWLLDRHTAVRRRGLLILGGLLTTGVSLLAFGASGSGPAEPLFGEGSFRARTWYWHGALEMWRARPLLGVGLDTFGPHWRTQRSTAAVRELGGENFTDAAHNVPLHLLATGGLVLAAAHALLAALVLALLVAGLRRSEGHERLLIGALGGCWLAYQVQSLVSIDQVPLIVLHYVLASAVCVASGRSSLKALRLGVPTTGASLGGSSPAAQTQPCPRSGRVASAGLLATVVLAVGVLSWQAARPLAGSAALQDGDQAAASGNGSSAHAAYDRATRLMPGQARPWRRLGQLHVALGKPDLALAAFSRAIERDPFDPHVALEGAALAEEQAQLASARRWFSLAARLDPRNPRTVLPVAEFELRQRRPTSAVTLLEPLTQVLPHQPQIWTHLGQALLEASDEAGAREAFERALALDPTAEEARVGLIELAVATP